MYDVLTKSLIFGYRNADKVINTNDKGRIFADIGQFTNAAKAVYKLDNAVGRGAQSAVQAMGKVAQRSDVMTKAVKCANWASNNVNPLLIGAAGYRILTSEDKVHSLKKEIFGMSTMFGVEMLVKGFFKSPTFLAFKNNVCKTPTQKAICSILEGIVFVGCSIAGSTLGYKIGENLYPSNKTKEENSNKLSIKEIELLVNNKNNLKNKLEDIDESEYFVLKNNKAIA